MLSIKPHVTLVVLHSAAHTKHYFRCCVAWKVTPAFCSISPSAHQVSVWKERPHTLSLAFLLPTHAREMSPRVQGGCLCGPAANEFTNKGASESLSPIAHTAETKLWKLMLKSSLARRKEDLMAHTACALLENYKLQYSLLNKVTYKVTSQKSPVILNKIFVGFCLNYNI